MIGAIFDIDRTIVKGTSMERLFIRYLFSKGIIGSKDILRTLLFILSHLTDPIYMHSRRPYIKGKKVDIIVFHAGKCVEERVLPRVSRKAIERINFHKNEGHKVVLLSGTLDILARPLAEYLKVEHVIASSIETVDGYYTGKVIPPLPYSTGKRDILFSLVNRMGIDLKDSFAYGDSISDKFILESVGHPHAINPDPLLKRIARKNKWPVEYWD